MIDKVISKPFCNYYIFEGYMAEKKKAKREVSSNAVNTMRKIRILSKIIDLQIDHFDKSSQCEEFFKKVRDKELLVSIRQGGYCADETLKVMFQKYSIR